MPSIDGPAEMTPGVHGQHAQLATLENLTTLSILTACFSRVLQIRKTSFTFEKSSLLNGRF
jgi:hypothetical protein